MSDEFDNGENLGLDGEDIGFDLDATVTTVDASNIHINYVTSTTISLKPNPALGWVQWQYTVGAVTNTSDGYETPPSYSGYCTITLPTANRRYNIRLRGRMSSSGEWVYTQYNATTAHLPVVVCNGISSVSASFINNPSSSNNYFAGSFLSSVTQYNTTTNYNVRYGLIVLRASDNKVIVNIPELNYTLNTAKTKLSYRFTDEQINTIASYIGSDLTLDVKFRLTLNGVPLGSSAKTKQIELNGLEAVPNFTEGMSVEDVNEYTSNMTGGTAFIGSESSIKIRFKAPTALYGATLKRYTVQIGDVSKSIEINNVPTYDSDLSENYAYHADADGEPVLLKQTVNGVLYHIVYCGSLKNYNAPSGEDVMITITATDNRGLNGVISRYEDVLEYNPPTISNFKVARVNRAGTVVTMALEGKFTPLTVNGREIISADTLTVSFRYREITEINFGSAVNMGFSVTEDNKIIFITFALLNNNGFSQEAIDVTPENENFVIRFDDDSRYLFEVNISDGFYSASNLKELPVSSVLVALRDGKIGINKLNPQKALDIEGDIDTSGEQFAAITHTRSGVVTDGNTSTVIAGTAIFGVGNIGGTPCAALELRNLAKTNMLARSDVYNVITEVGNSSFNSPAIRLWSDTLTDGINNKTYVGQMGHIYIINGNFYFVGSSGSISNLANVVAQNVSISSTEDIKENIESTSSVLDIFNNSSIYKYNYRKTEPQGQPENVEQPDSGEQPESGEIGLDGEEVIIIDDTEVERPKSYGFVIGDDYNTPQEVLSEDGKHISLYSMASLNWKATQELITKISELENEIALLKAKEVTE